MLFATVTTDRGDRRILSITGDCDLASAPELRRQLRAAASDVEVLVVDLAGAGVVDSVGLGLLVGANRRVGRLVVVAPQGSGARKAIDAAGLGAVLDVRDEAG